MNQSKSIIFPIEVKVRDLHSRIFLSLHLSDFKVFIGTQESVQKHIFNLPPSIFFDKSLSVNKLQFYNDIYKRGFKIVSLDEEGLSSFNNSYKYISHRISKPTLKLAEKIFTWGEAERKKIINAFPEYKNKIISTGNVRIDLNMHYQKSFYKELSSNLKKKHGDYIFFPSSFTVNHALGQKELLNKLKKLGRLKSKKDVEDFHVKSDFFKKTFDRYVNLVRCIAKNFKNRTIIVRPHPSEDRNFWKDFSKKFNNVKIAFDHPVGAWIVGASFVIHSSCTTGLEAFLLKKPVISFLPYKDNDYVKHISNEVSYVCMNEDEVSEVINNYKKPNYKKNIFFLKNHLENVKGEFGYTKIIKELNQIDIKQSYFNNLPIREKQSSLYLKKFKHKIHKLLYKTRHQYASQKNPGISLDEICSIIKDYKRIAPGLNNKNFSVDRLDEGLFVINNK